MRKVIAAINMTINGIADHTAAQADEETHQHYADLLRTADDILYGRVTFQLMENYWPALVAKPSGQKALDDFALAMENIRKVVFSNTLKKTSWASARISTQSIGDELATLRQQPGKNILIGSPSLIVAALNRGLVDEFQVCVHPGIAVRGMNLFEKIKEPIHFHLEKTKTFGCGAVVFYYVVKK